MAGLLLVLVACLASASAQWPWGMAAFNTARWGIPNAAQATLNRRTVTCLGYSESASFAATFEEGGGQWGGWSGMTATVEIVVSPSSSGVYSLVLTERSRGSGQCDPEDLGPIMRRNTRSGMGATRGFGFMPFMAAAQRAPEGVLREVRLSSSRITQDSIANVPFTSQQLGGHGMALCLRTSTDNMGRTVCEGKAIACCTLGYDNSSQRLPTA